MPRPEPVTDEEVIAALDEGSYVQLPVTDTAALAYLVNRVLDRRYGEPDD